MRRGSSPICAVPVLAAAWMPLASFMQQRAVPLFTTSTIASLRKASVDGFVVVVRHGVGCVALHDVVVAVAHVLQHVGRHHHAVVADAGRDQGHVQRRDLHVVLAEAVWASLGVSLRKASTGG